MLVGFVCRNYTSYKEEAVFTSKATNRDEYIDINTFDTKHGRLLKSNLIYGANASGKSNLFKAISFMKDMVRFSTLPMNIIKRNEAFKFLKHSQGNPTMFEISFILDEILYTYGFEILDLVITSEWLEKKYDRTIRMLDRTSPDWKDIELIGEFKDAESIKKNVSESSLVISVASMLNIKLAKKIVEAFDDIIIYDFENEFPSDTVEYLENNPEAKELILDCMRKADIGIDDFTLNIEVKSVSEEEQNAILKLIKIEGNEKIDIPTKLQQRNVKIETQHKIYNSEQEVIGNIMLPFIKYQSKGTLKFFQLLGPILNALDNGNTIIIDEIDSKLHCGLVRYILSMFNSLDINKNNAQLICNTHDVLLLDEDIRRDQIWFVEKNKYGESELYSLTDFKNVRKNDDILKKYLLGIYGATPFLKGSDI